MTTEKPKFLFDSCCFGRVGVNKLIEFLGSGGDEAQLAHLVDFQLHEELDDVWIPRMVDEGWVVITTDRGKRPSRGGKLPLLCRRFRMTHVLLSGAIHQLPTFDKARAIVAVWPHLLQVNSWPKGSEFRLQATANGRFVLHPPKSSSDEEPR